MKKVFASDFDGTLYFYKAEDDRKLPAENVAKSIGINAVFSRVTSAESYDKLMSGSVDCLWN